jgi:UDP-glucose 4-epimerase
MGVVVTGAAGFLGSVLVDLLAGRGQHVVAVDRRAVAPRRGVVPLCAELSVHDSRGGYAASKVLVEAACRAGRIAVAA